jgi:hypothetical protein
MNALLSGDRFQFWPDSCQMPEVIFLVAMRPFSNMSGVRRTISIAAIALLAGLGIWLGTRGPGSSGNDAIAHDKAKSRDPVIEEDAGAAPNFRTKSSIREIDAATATHRPERLKDFMLPEVAIDGLELEAALRKVLTAYQGACRRSGETPLALRFVVPPGNYRKLQLRLSARSFKTSVQLLATLSGMKVTRDELEYRFTKIENERKTTKRTLDVPPDFQNALHDLRQGLQVAQMQRGMQAVVDPNGDQTAKVPLRDAFARLGLELDPSTRLTLGADGKLAMETNNSADAAAVSTLARTLAEQQPIQQKFTTKVVELAADSEWTPPDLTQMDDTQVQLFMREMAQKQGTELMTMPSITARSGQSAAIEITRELIVPTDDAATTFETHNIGHVMHLQGSALGFGHDLALDYTNTTGDLDPATLKPVIRKQTEVKDAGFSSNGGTRFVVQTRPDGSRAIVLVTSTWIDATGRPLDWPPE